MDNFDLMCKFYDRMNEPLHFGNFKSEWENPQENEKKERFIDFVQAFQKEKGEKIPIRKEIKKIFEYNGFIYLQNNSDNPISRDTAIYYDKGKLKYLQQQEFFESNPSLLFKTSSFFDGIYSIRRIYSMFYPEEFQGLENICKFDFQFNQTLNSLVGEPYLVDVFRVANFEFDQESSLRIVQNSKKDFGFDFMHQGEKVFGSTVNLKKMPSYETKIEKLKKDPRIGYYLDDFFKMFGNLPVSENSNLLLIFPELRNEEPKLNLEKAANLYFALA